MSRTWEDNWDAFYAYNAAIQSQRERSENIKNNSDCILVEGMLICEIPEVNIPISNNQPNKIELSSQTQIVDPNMMNVGPFRFNIDQCAINSSPQVTNTYEPIALQLRTKLQGYTSPWEQ